MPLDYVPLFQSFIGSLGAFAVAAFTVWATNKQTRGREASKEVREDLAEWRKLRRSKVEDVLANVELAYRACTDDAAAPVHYSIALKTPGASYTPQWVDFSLAGDRLLVLAELHFPAMSERAEEFITSLYDFRQFLANECQSVISNPDDWVKGGGTTFVERRKHALESCIRGKRVLLKQSRVLFDDTLPYLVSMDAEPKGE